MTDPNPPAAAPELSVGTLRHDRLEIDLGRPTHVWLFGVLGTVGVAAGALRMGVPRPLLVVVVGLLILGIAKLWRDNPSRTLILDATSVSLDRDWTVSLVDIEQVRGARLGASTTTVLILKDGSKRTIEVLSGRDPTLAARLRDTLQRAVVRAQAPPELPPPPDALQELRRATTAGSP